MNYFADASRARVQLTQAQSRAIKQMYMDLTEDIAYEAKQISKKSNISSVLRRQYLEGLSRQINEELRRMGDLQGVSIRGNIVGVARAVITNNEAVVKRLGIDIAGSYSMVPTEVVNEIASGGLYKDRWTLSRAIWKNTARTQSDINTIVARGVAAQKSTYDIAKDLEDYVNPKKRKDWSWSKVYPGTARVVDYNAQRLARTMLSHAYEDTLVRTTKDNPFVECYEWLTSNSDRVCEICQERESGFHGVVINGKQMHGCYYAEDLPLDHPNGMCTIDVYIEKDYEAISNRLADWVNGAEDKALDNYARSLGYTSNTLKSKVIK